MVPIIDFRDLILTNQSARIDEIQRNPNRI